MSGQLLVKVLFVNNIIIILLAICGTHDNGYEHDPLNILFLKKQHGLEYLIIMYNESLSI